ncbi:hypothetical protein ABZW96_36300 [Nocardia sp. NPDC004168]|uniref:hypothetical protein n=1 Tax=Nocardia sp. NPDC004168 TaxID=3154452 RepID=UPI0033B030CD
MAAYFQPLPTQTCTFSSAFVDREFSERLSPEEAAEILERLGPAGVAAMRELLLLRQKVGFDAVVLEGGELNFYATERDFYVSDQVSTRPT